MTLSDAYSWIMLSFTLLLPIVINLRSKIATKNRSNRLFFGVALSIAIIEAFVSWLPLSLGTLGSAFLSFFGMELLNFKSEILTSKLSKDTLASLPLYVVGDKETEGYLPRRRLKHILTHIIDDPDSRKIFYFLCINFAFMFIEGLFGFWNNSLGLISDAAHMLFDCVALAISLYASYMSRMKSNETFTFGYGRYEIVAGLVNGIFLVFIAFSVFVESIERVYDPPTINSDNIIVVSVLGLVVNLIGVVFFHESQ